MGRGGQGKTLAKNEKGADNIPEMREGDALTSVPSTAVNVVVAKACCEPAQEVVMSDHHSVFRGRPRRDRMVI